jgi:hypothetical protein
MTANTNDEKAKFAEWTKVLSHNNYSSKKNQALRSVTKQGEIINSFNLDKLAETLNLNEELKKLLKEKKLIVKCDDPMKKPFTIQCELDGQPPISLCKIVQNSGGKKDEEKTFYVRIKTDLKTLKSPESDGKTLDYDAIKTQFDIAEAVGKVVEKMVASPFNGYTRTGIGKFKNEEEKEKGLFKISKKDSPKPTKLWEGNKEKKEEGKQEKAPDTGFYKKDGKLYYIKQSAKFPADDIAEVATSHLLKLGIGEQAVMYAVVPHETLLKKKTEQSVYLASEVSLKFKTLKEQVVLRDKTLGADLRTDQNKADVYKKLEESGAVKEMAKVLAGCLWVREPDCQYGNILLGSNGEVKKFDNGWGLVDICGSENARVKLFKKESPVSLLAFGTHNPLSGIPTNHLNDYPEIIRSQDFVDALEETLNNITPKVNGKITYEKIDTEVGQIVARIKKDYEKANPDEALTLFTKHIGLDVKNNTDNKPLEDFIKDSLAKRLKERADSMAVLQCLLKIDLALPLLDNKDLSANEVEALVGNLQKVIADRFTKENGYDMDNLTIREIIPPYDPPREELMEKLINVLNKDKQKNYKVIDFCELLSKSGKKKSVKLLVPPIVAQEVAPPLPKTPIPVIKSEAVKPEIVPPPGSPTSAAKQEDFDSEIVPPPGSPTSVAKSEVVGPGAIDDSELGIVPPSPDSPTSVVKSKLVEPEVIDDSEIVPPLPTTAIPTSVLAWERVTPPAPERPAPMSVRSPTPSPVDESSIVITQKSVQLEAVRWPAPTKDAPKRAPVVAEKEEQVPIVSEKEEPVAVSTPEEPESVPLTPIPTTEALVNIKTKLAEVKKQKELITPIEKQGGKPELPDWKRQLLEAKKVKPPMEKIQPQAEKSGLVSWQIEAAAILKKAEINRKGPSIK